MKLSDVVKAEKAADRRRELLEMRANLALAMKGEGDDVSVEISGTTEYLDPEIAADKTLLDAIGEYIDANLAKEEDGLKELGVEIDDAPAVDQQEAAA